MATGRKNCWDSWHDSSLDRRDFRDDHGGGPEEMPHRKKGGKKKWCKGRVGITCEFTVKVLKWSYPRFRAYTMQCPVCHKQKGYISQRLVEYTAPNGETYTYWAGG